MTKMMLILELLIGCIEAISNVYIHPYTYKFRERKREIIMVHVIKYYQVK